MKLYARRGFEWAEDGLVGLWSPVSTGATQGMLLDSNPSTSNHGIIEGQTNFNDSYRGSIHGTVFNNVASGSANCGTLNGNAFNFPFSVSAWVRNITGPGSDFGIVSKMFSTSAVYPGWGMLSSASTNGKLLAYWQSATRATSTTTITQSANWMQVGIFWTGAVAGVVVNGIVEATASVTTAPNASADSLYIGRYGFTSERSLRGEIAEVPLFARSLQSSEWERLFQAGPGGIWQDRPRRSRAYFGSSGTNRRRRILCGDYS